MDSPKIGTLVNVGMRNNGIQAWDDLRNTLRILGWHEEQLVRIDSVQDEWFILQFFSSVFEPLEEVSNDSVIKLNGVNVVLFQFENLWMILLQEKDWDKFLINTLHLDPDRVNYEPEKEEICVVCGGTENIGKVDRDNLGKEHDFVCLDCYDLGEYARYLEKEKEINGTH